MIYAELLARLHELQHWGAIDTAMMSLIEQLSKPSSDEQKKIQDGQIKTCA
ncbi:MAG: hypothetical protein LAO78_04535 [Acidobacteriia bacterium]|nr:hypothetical protein [Terriglobia bacterium]